ncbi:MAG: cation:proton antiporter [Cyanobacteriota bacterium]
MVISIAIIVLIALLLNYIFVKIKLPGLLGMLILGVILGPYVLNCLDDSLLELSAELRRVALIVILLRAGFELKKECLTKVGRSVLLLSIVPAIIEAVVITLLGPYLFDLTYLESAILGCIIAAVSPAVVVPMMINLIDRKIGEKKSIPTMMIASSSIDDVFVIVIFTILLGFQVGDNQNIVLKILEVPVNIILGVIIGLITGLMVLYLFKKFSPRATKMCLICLAVSVLLTWCEDDLLKGIITFSSLLAIMAMGYIILDKDENIAHKVSSKLSKIWVFAEIILFVLVGAQVNVTLAFNASLLSVLLIIIGLAGRSIGTYISVAGNNFNVKEKMFCVISYIPKATVQAAIGAIPLEMGVPGGEVILAISVISIMLTAPLGAIGISLTAEKFLGNK